MILCDIGNSTFNFFFTNSKKNIRFGLNDNLPTFLMLQKLDTNFKQNKNNKALYFISVNKKATKRLYKLYSKSKTINMAKLIEYKTLYKNMGVDKKVACFGIKNKIIIDAGSAISIDVIKNNTHLGGYLFLGLQEAIKSYANISKKLKVDYSFDKHVYKLDKIPTNTKNAIHKAVLKSLVLFVKHLSKKYKLNIISTGGDGKYIKVYFKNAKYNKNLIFENMQNIIKKHKNKRNM